MQASTTALQRQQVAETLQKSLHDAGCVECKVWGTGESNQSLHILDPEATAGNNDYQGKPDFYFDAGFDTVTYYSELDVVYAKHTP